MKSTRKRKPLTAEAIARLADRGRDVSRFFTNAGRMMGPIQRVNVDLAPGLLEELDRAAKELNFRPSPVAPWREPSTNVRRRLNSGSTSTS